MTSICQHVNDQLPARCLINKKQDLTSAINKQRYNVEIALSSSGGGGHYTLCFLTISISLTIMRTSTSTDTDSAFRSWSKINYRTAGRRESGSVRLF